MCDHVTLIAIPNTVCPGSSYPFYIVSYYIKRVTTSWTYGTFNLSFGKNLLLASSYKFLDKQYFLKMIFIDQIVRVFRF